MSYHSVWRAPGHPQSQRTPASLATSSDVASLEKNWPHVPAHLHPVFLHPTMRDWRIGIYVAHVQRNEGENMERNEEGNMKWHTATAERITK